MSKITVHEAAALYGKCEEQIRRLIRNGKVRAHMPSKREGYLIETEDLDHHYGRRSVLTMKESDVDELMVMFKKVLERSKQREKQRRKKELLRLKYLLLMKRDNQDSMRRNYIPRKRGS